MTEQSGSKRRVGLAILTPIALLASSFMVYTASNAAFSANTSNGSNTWSTGSVTITDDDSGNVMFNLSGLVPGNTGTKCINVTYGGNVPSAVKLYTSPYANNGLGQYLDFTLEEGTAAAGGANLDCTGFTAGSSLYTPGTLDGFATAHNSYATGVSTWAPSASATKSYKFTYTVKDDNGAQDKGVSATFVWEARNT